MLIFNKIMSNLKIMKITFLSLIIFMFFPILSLSANNVELTKNHKKAIAWDCKYNLNDEFDSINDCKNLLVIALKRDGVLFNLNNFKKKKIDKAEKSCSKRIKKGVYQYNACLAEYFDINIEIEEPPIVVANIDEEEISEESENTENENTENENISDLNEEQQERETNQEIILSANELYEKVVKSSFQVAAGTGDNWSCGSAVVIAKNKLATNCHVVLKEGSKGRILKNPQAQILVINHKSNAKIDSSWLNATLYASDPNNDTCIIQSSQVNAAPIEIKPYEEIEMLEKVYAIGGPECQRGIITQGEINAKFDFGYETSNPEGMCDDPNCWNNFSVKMLQTNAHIRGGSSGGGLFDQNGNLVGITTLGEDISIANPKNIAISADNFLKLLGK